MHVTIFVYAVKATTTPNSSSVPVKFTGLERFLYKLRSLSCGDHL